MQPPRVVGRAGDHGPSAFVLGDIDLVRPLSLAGVRSVVVTDRTNPARFSRGTSALDLPEDWMHGTELAERLVASAEREAVRPVLFYQSEAHLIYVSKHRERLADAFSFVIAEPDKVDLLVDKARWQELAKSLDLPVPRGQVIRHGDEADVDLRFPVVLKPLSRMSLGRTGFAGKAVRVDSPGSVKELLPRLQQASVDVLAQELVPGPESAIESYHAYLDASGAVVGEFTGRKLRTFPPEFGDTTALSTTQAPDVAGLGLEVLRRVELTGVAKVDFKRGPDGRLWLFEVNPRFTLWLHAGAVAGANLPAMVYADLTGQPRPACARVRAGVEWCNLVSDRWARRAVGAPLPPWVASALRSEVKRGLAWDDPMPFVRGLLWPRIRRLPRWLRQPRGPA